MQPTAIVAYLALFATVGFLFVLASLLLGRFLRAQSPSTQKLATYECGEPAVGPSSVQFDLRFYVVALVFLIFEVEVAFFFPPAAIFGKSVQQLGQQEKRNVSTATDEQATNREVTPADEQAEKTVLTPLSARTTATAAMIDLGVFFAVLLIGFAYLWRQGDLDWVRAVRHPATPMETAAMMSRLRRDGYCQ
jgi:NADH-quinone oxidoreductase subunit A